MKVTIRRTITIDWDGTVEDYIRLANKVSLENLGSGLDSFDAGDATGLFADPNLGIDWDDTIWMTVDGRLLGLRREYSDDVFEYDLPREDTNVILTEADL